mgnify:CR=1 FL=1
MNNVIINKSLTTDLAIINNLEIKDDVKVDNNLIVTNLLTTNNIFAKDQVKTTTLETTTLNVLDNVTIINKQNNGVLSINVASA